MADDQRPESFDDDQAQRLAGESVDPAGDQLNEAGDGQGDSYEVIDPEAEEIVNADEDLDSTPFEADPEDVQIDDAAQLAAAEQVARKARSSRPKRKASTATTNDEPVDESPAGETSAVAAQAAQRRPVRRKPVDKSEQGLATPSRKQATTVECPGRTTPVAFVNQSVGELRKVIWPTAEQLRQYFVVVLVFVLFIIAYVSVLDFGFGWVLLRLLGK